MKRAEARLDSAEKHLDGIQRKSAALKRIHDLFQEERRSLADQYTLPLATKIQSYLQRLYGADVQVKLELAENDFKGISISRSEFSNVSFDFHQLSGGAAEQVGAAVRLAIAELLAEKYGGCLPIIFDDAFTNSDPMRVKKLQSMLDLAAGNGLQVILLSCNGTDYRGLPAKEVALTRELLSSSTPGVSHSTFGSDEIDEDSEPSITGTVEITPEHSQALLGKLRELGGKAGNKSLREALAWNEETYSAVKDALAGSGKLLPGKGKGGSVMLPE